MKIDRAVLITGGASGICKEVALKMAKTHKTVVVLDKDQIALDQLVKEADGHLIGIPCDLTIVNAVTDVIQSLVKDGIKPTLLVNGVGGDARRIPFAELNENDLHYSLSQNLFTAFTVTRLLIPFMLEQQFGRIVNFSSVAGRTYTLFSNTAYVCAKSAILGLTKQLAYEFAGNGITVNAVAHGPIQTQRIIAAWEQKTEAQRAAIIEQIPVGRLGTVAEAADAIFYLCSEQAGYTTGSVLDCNGGMYI
jgi:3-oxoacyl-[acyl-carrier protein] reductase